MHDRVARIGVAGPDDLRSKAVGALGRPQRLPHIVTGFFRDSKLSYITA